MTNLDKGYGPNREPKAKLEEIERSLYYARKLVRNLEKERRDIKK